MHLPRLDQAPRFPKSWSIFVDEILPAIVKERYSPKDIWKKKPFNKDDIRFFSKGLLQLHETLTEERMGAFRPGSYFSHPAARSSYLLYFLPFQGAKFLALFDLHSEATKHWKIPEGRPFRVLDIGAGPGTASLAFMSFFRENISANHPLHLTWVDSDRKILEDGEALLEKFNSTCFPKSNQELKIIAQPLSNFRFMDDFDFILIGHVLNEVGSGPNAENKLGALIFDQCFPRSQNGILILEPATKTSAQRLSRIRDSGVANEKILIEGPCLHAKTCPLSEGRDWCHFSIPAKTPGSVFAEFSKQLGSERNWLKLSYLWLGKNRQKTANINMKRVVSDSMPDQGKGYRILICEPNQVASMPVQRKDFLRGGLIPVSLSKDVHSLHQPENRKPRRGKGPW